MARDLKAVFAKQAPAIEKHTTALAKQDVIDHAAPFPKMVVSGRTPTEGGKQTIIRMPSALAELLDKLNASEGQKNALMCYLLAKGIASTLAEMGSADKFQHSYNTTESGQLVGVKDAKLLELVSRL